MHFLKTLLIEQEEEPSDRLTDLQMDELKKNIRDGTKPDKDTGEFQPWRNALHLVHKAYEVAKIQRPTPDMKELWKQYEEIIQFAVEQLSKTRGIDGDWRMTAHEKSD